MVPQDQLRRIQTTTNLLQLAACAAGSLPRLKHPGHRRGNNALVVAAIEQALDELRLLTVEIVASRRAIVSQTGP